MQYWEQGVIPNSVAHTFRSTSYMRAIYFPRLNLTSERCRAHVYDVRLPIIQAYGHASGGMGPSPEGLGDVSGDRFGPPRPEVRTKARFPIQRLRQHRQQIM